MASKIPSTKVAKFVSALFSGSQKRPHRANRRSQSYYDENPNFVEVRHAEGLEDRMMLTFIEADEALGIIVEQGGSPVQNGQVMNIEPNGQVNGAIEDVLAHPTNADIVYIGAINGGIWKTENATDTNPSWVPQSDHLESLSIGAIEFDIADPTYQQLVAGTGRFSSFGSAGGAQGLVYITNDGGDTWFNPGSVGLPVRMFPAWLEWATPSSFLLPKVAAGSFAVPMPGQRLIR